MVRSLNITWAKVERASAYQYGLLAGFVLFAALLRFYKLGEWSFWSDELFTVRDALNIFERGLNRSGISFALTRLVLVNLGVNEWSARLVSALFGVISIPAIYFPTRKIFGTPTALLAALLLTVAPWHLYWSQNARFYTSLLLFYTLALFAFYIGIEEDRPWYLVLFLLLMGIAVQERLFALLILPVVGGYLLLLKLLPFEKPPGLRMRNLIILFAPAVFLALVFSSSVLIDPSRWSVPFSWINNNPFWIVAGVVYYVTIPVVVLGLAGGVYLLLKKDRAALLFSLGAVVPLAAIVFISLFQYTANRYVFVSLTSWIILASAALWSLASSNQGSSRLLAVGVVLLMLAEPMGENLLYYQYQHGNRANWIAAANLVNQRKAPEDAVIVDNTMLGDYYFKEETLSIEGVDFETLAAGGQRAWILEDMNVGEKRPEQLRWIQENAQLIGNFDVVVRARNFKMRVYLFDPDSRVFH